MSFINNINKSIINCIIEHSQLYLNIISIYYTILTNLSKINSFSISNNKIFGFMMMLCVNRLNLVLPLS